MPNPSSTWGFCAWPGFRRSRDTCLRSGDLLVETSLTGPDLPYSFQELVEIVFAELFALLEAFIVQDESFYDEFAEGFGGPDAEAGSFY